MSYTHLHSSPTRRSSDLLKTHTTIFDCFFSYFFSCIEPDQLIIKRSSIGDQFRLNRLQSQFCCLKIGKRSEEHTSELQSRGHLVCRLLLENNNTNSMLR